MGSIYALTFFTEIALAKLLIQMLTYVDPQGSNNLLKARCTSSDRCSWI